VPDDLRGRCPRGGRPRRLQRGVAVRVIPDGGRPGVHDLDGLGGIAGIPRDVPHERERVRGDRVLALVGAAEVRVGVGAALDDRARAGCPGQGSVGAAGHLVVGVEPWLRAGVDPATDEVQLRAAHQDPGMGERRWRGGDVRGGRGCRCRGRRRGHRLPRQDERQTHGCHGELLCTTGHGISVVV
jgi:hypothetical protein